MKQRLYTLLAALPARQLNQILVGLVLIAATLAWSVALRAPLAAYRQQGASLAALEAARRGAPATQAGAAPLEPATAPVVAPAPLALIAAVSRSATRHGVSVSSAAQGAPATVANLRLHTIDIAASGSYAGILAWLADIEAGQPAVGISGFELQPGATDTGREIRLQLTIYERSDQP